MEYALHIGVLCLIYGTLAVSLGLLVGQIGLLSLAHGAFFGLGAYTSALLSLGLGFPFVYAFAGAVVFGAACSLAVSIPALRLHDDYFVIATFGFQLVVVSIFKNWIEVTGGPMGVRGIARPDLFGVELGNPWLMFLLAALLLSFALTIVWRLARSPFGRVMRAISEDEILAASLGKKTFWFKIIAVAASTAIASSAGALYAHFATYIEPTGFDVTESILIVSMVIIGGARTTWGPIIGAVVLVVLPELLRLTGIPSHVAANLRQITYGAALVAMMFIRPGGLVPARVGEAGPK